MLATHNAACIVIMVWSMLPTRGLSSVLAQATPDEADGACLSLLSLLKQDTDIEEGSRTIVAKLGEEMEQLTDMVWELKNNVASPRETRRIVTGVLHHHVPSREDMMLLKQEVEELKAQRSYRDCSDVPNVGDGVYGVYVPGDPVPKHVFCDQTTAGGGWLVFQRRMDGSENFLRNWTDYAQGFGNLNAEFWLGNDLLSALTTKKKYKLRVDLEDFDGEWRYAEYEDFRVDNARNKYRITFGSYSGNAGDPLRQNHGMYFTTVDRDFDMNENKEIKNCAVLYKGAWWYTECHEANLNGLYLGGRHESYADGINWSTWRGFKYSLKTTEMKIKPMD